jgi:hypothetical protein
MLSADRPSGRAATGSRPARRSGRAPVAGFLASRGRNRRVAAGVELGQAVLVMAHHPRLQKRTRVPGAQRRDVRIAQHLGAGPLRKRARPPARQRWWQAARPPARNGSRRGSAPEDRPATSRNTGGFLPSVRRRARPGAHRPAAAPGRDRSARPMATRCVSPPDRSRGRRSSSPWANAQQVDDPVELLRRAVHGLAGRSGAHRSGSGAHRDAGTAGPPGRHSPCAACGAARNGRGRCRRRRCRRWRSAPGSLEKPRHGLDDARFSGSRATEQDGHARAPRRRHRARNPRSGATVPPTASASLDP